MWSSLSTAVCSCRGLSTGREFLGVLCLLCCDNRIMSSRQMTVIRSSERCRMTCEEQEPGLCLHVMRGCYVQVEDPRLLETPWSTWTTVARARLLAVHASGSGDRVFVGPSSLVCHGIAVGGKSGRFRMGSYPSWEQAPSCSPCSRVPGACSHGALVYCSSS